MCLYYNAHAALHEWIYYNIPANSKNIDLEIGCTKTLSVKNTNVQSVT